MARILVVSESSALSVALATTDHDIVEVQPADAESYEADVFIVDLDQPIDAVGFLGDLAAEASPPPTVVVIGDSPEWHSVHALDVDRLAVVERPVSRASLLAAVDHLLSGGPLSGPPASTATIQVPEQAQPLIEPADLPLEPLEVSDSAAPAIVTDAAAPTTSLSEAATRPASTRSHKASKPPKTPRARGRRRATDTAPEPPPRRASRPSLSDAANELVEAAHRLQGLDIVACDTVGRAMAAVDGTAGALLVPDGAVWRTGGGLALRPREWMTELPPDSWIVDVVVRQQRAVIVEDTDIARQQLVNVPLARCRNLAAVPLPRLDGALLIGRDDDGFDEEDLRAIAEIGQQAEEDLAAALQLRDVADALHRFAERRTL